MRYSATVSLGAVVVVTGGAVVDGGSVVVVLDVVVSAMPNGMSFCWMAEYCLSLGTPHAAAPRLSPAAARRAPGPRRRLTGPFPMSRRRWRGRPPRTEPRHRAAP